MPLVPAAAWRNSQPHWGLFMQRGGSERWEVQFWEAVFQARKSKVQHQLVGTQNRKLIQAT